MLLPGNSISSHIFSNNIALSADVITAMILLGGFSYATNRICLLPVRMETQGLPPPNVGPVAQVHCLKLLVVYCDIHSHTLQNSPYILSLFHTWRNLSLCEVLYHLKFNIEQTVETCT